VGWQLTAIDVLQYSRFMTKDNAICKSHCTCLCHEFSYVLGFLPIKYSFLLFQLRVHDWHQALSRDHSSFTELILPMWNVYSFGLIINTWLYFAEVLHTKLKELLRLWDLNMVQPAKPNGMQNHVEQIVPEWSWVPKKMLLHCLQIS